MKFLVHTYGCQMNVRDSEAVEAMLATAGHVKAESEAEAELVIVNSCTVRQKAEEKAVGKTGNLCAAGKLTGLTAATGTKTGRQSGRKDKQPGKRTQAAGTGQIRPDLSGCGRILCPTGSHAAGSGARHG